MGLDACVYLSNPDLPQGLASSSVLRDEHTGEPYTLPPHTDLPRECVVAIEESIGNLALVAWLREKLQHSGMRYVELRRLLQHGTASGTVFPVEAATRIGAEARELICEHANDKEVVNFCEKVTRLASVSQAERNPIVLV